MHSVMHKLSFYTHNICQLQKRRVRASTYLIIRTCFRYVRYAWIKLEILRKEIKICKTIEEILIRLVKRGALRSVYIC